MLKSEKLIKNIVVNNLKMCYNRRMKEIFEQFNIVLNDNQQEKFEKYLNLLLEYNQKFNITAITERNEIIIKHFIDSLLGKNFVDCGKLIDIGSGGGFPAIPLKIMNENISLTMLEATEKKCGFLKTVASELGLKDVTVICGRAEEFSINPKYRESYDYVSARAVARLNILSEYCMPFSKVGGKFIAFKGSDEKEIEEGKSAIKTLGGEIESVNEFDLDGAKRNIVVIKKIEKTPKQYPRKNGQIRKKPL